MKKILKYTRIVLLISLISLLIPIASIVVDVEYAIASEEPASIVPINAEDVTPVSGTGWLDIDCSAYIPEEATGVVFHYAGGHISGDRQWGVRKKGSTDNRYVANTYKDHQWGMIGVDENLTFQYYRNHIDGNEIYLVGYTLSGVTFRDNGYMLEAPSSPDAPFTWYTRDVSVQCPDAEAVILQFYRNGLYSFAARIYGSTDERFDDSHSFRNDQAFAVVGCDSSQRIQICFPNESNDPALMKAYIIGYITEGVEMRTNALDISLSSAGSYQDIDLSTACPTGTMAIIEVESYNPGTYNYALRQNDDDGDDVNVYDECNEHDWGIIEMDTNQVIEGKIEHTDVDFYLLGYSFGVLPCEVSTYAATYVAPTSAQLNGEVTDDGEGTIDIRGFEWGTTTGVYDYSWDEYGTFGEETFNRTISGLTNGQTYYFRAYAHNVTGYSYGTEQNFTAGIGAPDIDTESASLITVTTARLNSTVTDDGGEACEVRFGLDISSQSSFEDYAISTAWVDGYYENSTPYASITGLSANQIYYFRAQIKNTDSTVTSTTEKYFTTAATVGDVTNFYGTPDCNYITLIWTKAPNSVNTMIRYRTDTYPVDVYDGTLAYNSTGYHTSITGLDEGQTYYFSAWGYDSVYSTTEANLALSTLICAGDSDTDDALDIDIPDNINDPPDMSGFQLEPFTTIISIFNAGLGMPEDNIWEVLYLLFIIGVALIIYVKSKNFFIAFFILILLTIIGVGVHLTQGWLVYAEFIIGAGVWSIQSNLQ